MPNWASTTYVFKGSSKEQAIDLYEKINQLHTMEKPFVENGFGKLWMGCLVNYLGGDYEKVYCRGEIVDYNLNGDLVNIACETAWDEMSEFRHFIEQQYPGSKVYYCVEEYGNDVYATNDAEGLYFPDRYCLDSYDGLEYYETIDEAAGYIGEIIGKELSPDFAEIENAIEDYMEERGNSEERWMSFHRYQVLDD